MRSWYRASAIGLLSLLVVQPALGAVCLAACEPTQPSVSDPSHPVAATACHEDDSPDMQVSAAGMSACGDHDRALDDRIATVTASRDSLDHLLAPARSLTTPFHPRTPGFAGLPGTFHSFAAPSTPSAVLIALRI